MTFKDWQQMAENNYDYTIVPAPSQVDKHAWELDRAYWKGYYEASKDAARFVKE